jgi:HD-GYP domain-containing protein (c-di-GMP phosphodiesterase class II)
MSSFVVKEIPAPCRFTEAVYLDKEFVVAAPAMVFDGILANALTEWGFSSVLSDGEPGERMSVLAVAGVAKEDAPVAVPAGAGTAAADKIQAAVKFYSFLASYVRTLFGKFSAGESLDYLYIERDFRKIIDQIRFDYKFILRLRPQNIASDDDYLVYHAVNTTIICVIIGNTMKMPLSSLVEIGIAAMLHDIGMLKLPRESYLNGKRLSQEEKRVLRVHPVVSYNFLKPLDFPESICRAVLEHHERENAAGYPRKKDKSGIHAFSKILAVACSYAAITAKRPYREAADRHAGMMEILKNEGKQYNDKVVSMLVSAMTFFPIGLYVELSDRRVGQVVDINPKKPYYPIVRIIDRNNADGVGETVETGEHGVSVSRALSLKGF